MGQPTRVREGLEPLLYAAKNTDHFKLLESLENRVLEVHKNLQGFNGLTEIGKYRNELPQYLAEVQVISELLIFRLSMHMGEYDDLLSVMTNSYTDQLSPVETSDDNYDDLDF